MTPFWFQNNSHVVLRGVEVSFLSLLFLNSSLKGLSRSQFLQSYLQTHTHNSNFFATGTVMKQGNYFGMYEWLAHCTPIITWLELISPCSRLLHWVLACGSIARARVILPSPVTLFRPWRNFASDFRQEFSDYVKYLYILLFFLIVYF